MKSPKQRLLERSIEAAELANLLADSRIETAVDTAFAEYCFRLHDENPAAADLRRQGANQVLSLLMTIADPVIEHRPSLPPSLH